MGERDENCCGCIPIRIGIHVLGILECVFLLMNLAGLFGAFVGNSSVGALAKNNFVAGIISVVLYNLPRCIMYIWGVVKDFPTNIRRWMYNIWCATIIGYVIATIVDLLFATVLVGNEVSGTGAEGVALAVGAIVWAYYLVGLALVVTVDAYWGCVHKRFWLLDVKKSKKKSSSSSSEDK